MTEQNKIPRLDSKSSIGFPESNSNSDKSSNNKKKSTTEVKETEELVTNVCHLLIHCERHDKICVSNVLSKGLWLPSIPIRFNDSWTLAARELLEKIGIKSDVFKTGGGIINILRIQLTQTSNFVTRFTFFVRIPKDPKQSKCCLNDEKYKWNAVKHIIDGSDSFWGPEIKLWVRSWIRNENVTNFYKRVEYDTKDALRDYCDHPTICTTNEQIMIRSACFAEKDILRLYDLFLQHCYPSQYMTFTSFKLFVRKIGLKISENNLNPTFRAFDSRKRSYFNFNELLLGLAAMDQATEHGGQSSIRLTYVMRFYDSDSDGYLSHSDICHMIVDIQRLPNSPHKNTYDIKKGSVEAQATQIIKAHGSNNRISLKEFIKAISSLKFRGTSGLFRAPGSTLKHVIKLMADEKSDLLSVAMVRLNKYDSCCDTCRRREYRLSRLVYRMSKSGEVLNYIDLNRLLSKGCVEFATDLPEVVTLDLATELINKLNEVRRLRFETSDLHNNELLTNWLYPTKQILIKKLMTICEKCRQLFEKEERVLRISTPCYIFGDIHGNLKDLMTYAHDFWRMSPLLSECNYLFLGDIVDRGQFGVECVIYLFALKLVAPKTFWLVRGNHEVRSMQEQFTFAAECKEGYNEELWNAINEVFDRLPIAAVVDNKLFCSHGGIPTSTNSIEVLRMAPIVLPDPQNESPPVWEVLWNDPMGDEEFRQLSSFDRKEVEENMNGFLSNIKRGTGFYYSEQAINKFLENNDIQHIIRGHEVVHNGYRFQMNGKVITVFSTSLYYNGNYSATIFVNQNKIRVIRVHTFD